MSRYVPNKNKIHVGEFTTLLVEGKEVSVYDLASLEEAGLYIVETYASTVPNRSAVRVLLPLEGKTLEIETFCCLTRRRTSFTVTG